MLERCSGIRYYSCVPLKGTFDSSKLPLFGEKWPINSLLTTTKILLLCTLLSYLHDSHNVENTNEKRDNCTHNIETHVGAIQTVMGRIPGRHESNDTCYQNPKAEPDTAAAGIDPVAIMEGCHRNNTKNDGQNTEHNLCDCCQKKNK